MILNTPDNFKSHLGQEAQLVEILNGIQQDVSEIHSIILVSSEGLPMASTRFDTSERDIVLSAMTAALINVAEQTSCELDKGDPNSLIIECPQGFILLRRTMKNKNVEPAPINVNNIKNHHVCQIGGNMEKE